VHLLDQDRWTNLRAWRGFSDVNAARELVKSFGWERLRDRWRSQRAHAIPDTHSEETWILAPGLEYIRSWVGAALIVKGRLIGELSIDSATVNAYDESAAQTALAFANQAAIAIENARLYQKAQQEIAERTQIEEALRKSRERYRRVSELASDFAYSMRIEGHGGPVLEWTTEAFTRITGYAVDQFRSIDFWRRLVHPDDWPILTAQVQALSAGRSDVAEFRITTKSGEVRWLRNYGRPVWDETQRQVVRVYGAVQDITERVRADQVLRRRTAELRARNEELDAFSYTVAHDLKNPLSVTIASAETLLEGLSETPPRELKKVLRSIARNGRRMNAIIDSLLLLAGVREMTVEPELVDMGGIVGKVLERLGPAIEEHQAEIILPDSWPVAVGYVPWLERVWNNYLTNALKYGGRPPRLKLGGAPCPDRQIRFWVKDNGPGLTPEQQIRLFAPFVRLNRFSDVGHGLGLTIVKRIVEKLGGEVSVESKMGQGSVFSFTLPRG
jgi:PAS domain S-box-containing protein